jgi:hypothetical protein
VHEMVLAFSLPLFTRALEGVFYGVRYLSARYVPKPARLASESSEYICNYPTQASQGGTKRAHQEQQGRQE